MLQNVTALGEVDQREVCLPGSVSALVGTPDSPLSPSAWAGDPALRRHLALLARRAWGRAATPHAFFPRDSRLPSDHGPV